MVGLIRIFYNIMTAVADIFLNSGTVVGCGKGWIHNLPGIPVELDDIIYPAFVINICADSGMVGISGVTDFQFGRNIL